MRALYGTLTTFGIASSASLAYQANSDRTKVFNLNFCFFHVKKTFLHFFKQTSKKKEARQMTGKIFLTAAEMNTAFHC